MQVVDLQEDEGFQDLNVELLQHLAGPVDDWHDAGREMGITNFDGILSDAGNEIATA